MLQPIDYTQARDLGTLIHHRVEVERQKKLEIRTVTLCSAQHAETLFAHRHYDS